MTSSRRSSWNRVSDKAMTFENGNYGFVVQSITAELNSTFSNKLSNKFYLHIQRFRTKEQHLLELYFLSLISDGSATGGNYISFGTELFSYLNDVINNNYSFTNNLTYVVGKHTITGGVAFDLQKIWKFLHSYGYRILQI